MHAFPVVLRSPRVLSQSYVIVSDPYQSLDESFEELQVTSFLHCLPAEPAFPCGDDNNNNNTTTTLADLDWGFSRPAAVRGPGSADLDWGFSRPAAVRGPGSADLA